jgi:hypothetical protein
MIWKIYFEWLWSAVGDREKWCGDGETAGTQSERNAAANRRRKSARFAIHEFGQDGQEEMLRARAESTEAGRSISACWS